MALRLISKAKATLHSPSAALKRSSFILEWREPFSVSTRGRPSWSELLKEAGQGQNFCLHVFVQIEELGLKLVADFDGPSHSISMTPHPYDVNYI